MGSIPSPVIPKNLKIVLASHLLGAQHYESKARNQNWSAQVIIKWLGGISCRVSGT